jgi:tubulin delta
MSIITLQVGQCGNQIGEKLFETIVSDCYDVKSQIKQSNLKRAYSLNALNSTGSKEIEPKNEFSKLNDDYVYESKKRFFTELDYQNEAELKNSQNPNYDVLYARSVLIDMESKVVNKLIYSDKNTFINSKWKYREENSYTQKKGSGNNWSYGYCINGLLYLMANFILNYIYLNEKRIMYSFEEY